ncbi:MAG: type II secretion system protein [Verrucomicrobiales bacterium]|nr:type II secretion system protein [Verrucomicrobiales bacterium]
MRNPQERNGARAFTLPELVISIAILGVVTGGIIYGFANSTRVAEWNAYSLAAQSLAFQGVELARAAKWDPMAWPQVDEWGITNFTEVEILDVPIKKTPVYATNFISVSWVTTNPPLRRLQAACVWRMPGRGLFTNFVTTLRAPDQ